MIHSTKPTVSPVANIVFCCFVILDLKSGDGRTDGRTTCVKTIIPTGRDFGLAEWINSLIYFIFKNIVLLCSEVKEFEIGLKIDLCGRWTKFFTPLLLSRGIDVNKRTVTTHCYSLL